MSAYFEGWDVYFTGFEVASTPAETPIAPIYTPGGGGGGGVSDPQWRKRDRDDIEQDIRAALDRLEHAQKAAQVVARTDVPEQRVVAISARLATDISHAEEVLAHAITKVQRTRLQLSIASAIDARIELVARSQAAKAIAKARGRRAAAFLAVILGDD